MHEWMEKHFPVRRTEAEKHAFRQWILAKGKELGYRAHVTESGKKRAKNVIFGDPSQADVLLTAHYDTPVRSFLPFVLLPRNIVLYALTVLSSVLVLLLPSVVVWLVWGLAFHQAKQGLIAAVLVYVGLLLWQRFGPANRHNANASTSGVAAILAIMEQLPPEKRDKVAFVLFDEGENGLAGAKAYAREHEKIRATTLVIHLDNLGVGEHVLLTARKMAIRHPLYGGLLETFTSQGDYQVHHLPSLGSTLLTDDRHFFCGVHVMACHRRKGVGYYLPGLKSNKDTQCKEENLAFVVERCLAFVQGME